VRMRPRSRPSPIAAGWTDFRCDRDRFRVETTAIESLLAYVTMLAGLYVQQDGNLDIHTQVPLRPALRPVPTRLPVPLQAVPLQPVPLPPVCTTPSCTTPSCTTPSCTTPSCLYHSVLYHSVPARNGCPRMWNRRSSSSFQSSSA